MSPRQRRQNFPVGLSWALLSESPEDGREFGKEKGASRAAGAQKI